MKIWLDAGHGGSDPGTLAFGVEEKDWTLDIDDRIANILSHNGIQYERTRRSDVGIPSDIRTARIRNSNAKYCISSHINAGGGEGAETIHSIYSQRGEQLAQLILEELGKVGLNTRRAYSKEGNNGDYYYMHRETGSVTTIIVEYGFIDNREDHNFLSRPENRQRCAQAVVKGLFRMEGIHYKPMEDAIENPGESEAGKLLQLGDRGLEVRELQENLMKLGYSLENYGADEIYGQETEAAVMQFQRDNNLSVDGIVGPETRGKMQELLGEISQGTLYRVIVDGEQIGAYRVYDNILNQVKDYLGRAQRIEIEKNV